MNILTNEELESMIQEIHKNIVENEYSSDIIKDKLADYADDDDVISSSSLVAFVLNENRHYTCTMIYSLFSRLLDQGYFSDDNP